MVDGLIFLMKCLQNAETLIDVIQEATIRMGSMIAYMLSDDLKKVKNLRMCGFFLAFRSSCLKVLNFQLIFWKIVLVLAFPK